MATAQQMPAGPRSGRLADDAATAALYATQPRRKPSTREAPAAESQSWNTPATRATRDLSHASAASALAHANQKPFELWRPGRLADAEKAAYHAKDVPSPESLVPNTGASAWGLEAATLAVREQRAAAVRSSGQQSPLKPENTGANDLQTKARHAATGAFGARQRQRADSAPSEPSIVSDSNWALSAAEASHRARAENEGPLDHLDKAMEASRIKHANLNARQFTSTPSVDLESQDRNRRNSLHAAALVMARDMYELTGPTGETKDMSPALSAARNGHNQLRASKSVSGTHGTTGRQAVNLQEEAQRRAAEKLARMRDEHADMQQYYGTAPQAQSRSLLGSRRKRATSDADAQQVDAEQSRQIRNQMFSLRNKLNEVDEGRQKDRDSLMEAARRNVDARMRNMDMQIQADTGRAPPATQRQWDEVAQERVRQEAEAAESQRHPTEQINIGSSRYMDMADVEALARSRLQPTFDEMTDQAERRRADELERRLDAEEKQRQANLQRQREASLTRAQKQDFDRANNEKRGSKGLKLFMWKRKSKQQQQQQQTEDYAGDDDMNGQNEAATSPADEDDLYRRGSVASERGEQAADHETTPHAAADNTVAALEPAVTAQSARRVETPAAVEPEPVTSNEPVTTTEPVAPSPDASRTKLDNAAPISPPVSISHGPADLSPGGTQPGHSQLRDAAATGGSSSAQESQPVASPRADSKLKTWFRDRLLRRTSEPQPLYPHQPGPEYSSDGEAGFSGGAALAGRPESSAGIPRSQSVGDEYLATEQGGEGLSSTEGIDQNGKNGTAAKKSRFRQSLKNTLTRGSQDGKTNGSLNKRDDGNGEYNADLQNLRDSAAGQGLPVPPVLSDSHSHRESRFSEDL
ncbi:Uncharacterized protein PECH_007041 [Penicillium ucsense]|uniref:Eisosome protein 1 n=1 Tax=Penicillium ucsense TaxID=2839758 RepID=A0A8J8W0H0_9EURO|nr:Uncharacterized protein PECM_006800 [Penicillium ucsense]KAF7735244.1 Uncharacterized protein PECH_007041 [Penicillium ucsense]